jgi:hypothetical protein
MKLDGISDKVIFEAFSDKTYDLINRVLICPLSKTTYRDDLQDQPVCFHGWVIRKSALQCQALYDQNAFDGYSIDNLDSYATHTLTKELLRWLRALIDQSVIPETVFPQDDLLGFILSQDRSRPQNLSTTLARTQLQGRSILDAQRYAKLSASQAITARDQKLKVIWAETKIVQFQEWKEASKQQLQVSLASAKAELNAEKERILKNIASLEEVHGKKVQVLETQLETHAETNATQRKTLQTLLNTVNENLQHIQELESQLAADQVIKHSFILQIQGLTATIASLQQSINNMSKPEKSRRGGGCVIQ